MNTEDARLKSLEKEKTTTLNNQNKLYDNLLSQNQELLNKQNSWQDTYQTQQNAIYDKSTQLATSDLQQKQQANEQAYQKEATASESSYQKAINPYGVQAEQQAAAGLQNSGYSETAKMMAYNTARNRTAIARSTAKTVDAEYQKAISEAQLNNDTQKAALALELLQSKLQNELTAFQTSSGLQQNKLASQQATDQTYYGKYQDVIAQQNYEKEQANALKQYEQELLYKKQRDQISDKQYQQQLAQAKAEAATSAAQWRAEFNLSQAKASSSVSSKSSEQLTGTKGIQTPYYSGSINPDVKNGTFNSKDVNGIKYQPDNVGGSKLKSSGKKVFQVLGKGSVGSTGVNVDNQKVWTTNGKYYVWDGSQNKYIDVSNLIKKK